MNHKVLLKCLNGCHLKWPSNTVAPHTMKTNTTKNGIQMRSIELTLKWMSSEWRSKKKHISIVMQNLHSNVERHQQRRSSGATEKFQHEIIVTSIFNGIHPNARTHTIQIKFEMRHKVKWSENSHNGCQPNGCRILFCVLYDTRHHIGSAPLFCFSFSFLFYVPHRKYT